MQDLFYFWHLLCYVYQSCFSHIFISVSCQNKIVIQTYHIRDWMFYTNWQIRCTLITGNTWRLPPNLESTQNVICELGIADKMGSFSFQRAGCQGSGELMSWTLFIRDHKDHEHRSLYQCGQLDKEPFRISISQCNRNQVMWVSYMPHLSAKI